MTPAPFQAFTSLRQFARRSASAERCELCASVVPPLHDHLVEPGQRKLVCACPACAILFSGAGQRYRRVPREVRRLSAFRMTDSQWDSLMVPINVAFFFQNSLTARVTAMYPSPAGATESLLPLETWEQIADENPVLRAMQPDVEGLLVNRLGEHRGYARHQYYLLPIDECFRLVGLVRVNWRGLSGGEEMWIELERYFAGLAGRAGEERHA